MVDRQGAHGWVRIVKRRLRSVHGAARRHGDSTPLVPCESKSNEPPVRKVGGYLLWAAIAATCITSSMFLTTLAPNLPAIELIDKTAKVLFTGMDWFTAFAPIGLVLLTLGLWIFGVIFFAVFVLVAALWIM
ncbi:MAG: anion permease [Burkholderiales bacterium]|nr:anion permease [Burkholderiales bacterium]